MVHRRHCVRAPNITYNRFGLGWINGDSLEKILVRTGIFFEKISASTHRVPVVEPPHLLLVLALLLNVTNLLVRGKRLVVVIVYRRRQKKTSCQVALNTDLGRSRCDQSILGSLCDQDLRVGCRHHHRIRGGKVVWTQRIWCRRLLLWLLSQWLLSQWLLEQW
jgi:hypothetical protein